MPNLDWRKIEGWWGEDCHNFYERVVSELPFDANVAEIGCWLGRSTGSFISALASANKTGVTLHCIDTWKGSPPESDGGYHQNLIASKSLQLFDMFKKNVHDVNPSYEVNSVVSDSVKAAEEFEDKSLDFIFIDADHRRAAVCSDVSAWWPKLRFGGIMAGHDGNNVNVIQGVHDAGHLPTIKGMIWEVRKRFPLAIEATNDDTFTVGCLRSVIDPQARNQDKVTDVFGSAAFKEIQKLKDVFEFVKGPRSYPRIRVASCSYAPFLELGDPQTLVICPCDKHDIFSELKPSVREWVSRAQNESRDSGLWFMFRSAGPLENAFPAFPHARPPVAFPFISPEWEPPVPEWTEKPKVGFMGVAYRPKSRYDAINIAETSSLLDTTVVRRKSFMGLDEQLGREEVARSCYASFILSNQYQIAAPGVGRFSYRLYETLAAGRIPIIVGDHSIPFLDELPWYDMAVIVPTGRIHELPERVEAFHYRTKDKFTKQCLDNREIWKTYLSPWGFWKQFARLWGE